MFACSLAFFLFIWEISQGFVIYFRIYFWEEFTLFTPEQVRNHMHLQGTLTNTTPTAVRTSHENVTSRFCNHFSVTQRHYACKMCSNYPGIKLELALQLR